MKPNTHTHKDHACQNTLVYPVGPATVVYIPSLLNSLFKSWSLHLGSDRFTAMTSVLLSHLPASLGTMSFPWAVAEGARWAWLSFNNVDTHRSHQ